MVVADGDVPVTGVDDPWTVALFAAHRPEAAIGSGVLIDRRRVLTCWHVVDRQHDPATPLTVAFPKAGVSPEVRRTVAAVRGNPVEDVAVLELTEPAPLEAQPAQLRSPEPGALRGSRWWAFGFPANSPYGSEAHGVFGGSLSYGCVALERLSRYPVTAGFSGSGVWSEAFGAVVAMVGTAHTGAGDAQAVTLYRVERLLPDERLQDRTVWSVAEAGDAALGAWGWSLQKDVEAVRHWRPRARGVSIDTESGYRFRGRSTALNQIVSWLSRSRPDPRVLIVTGSPGVGKSAVLGRIVTTADREVQAALPEDDHNVRAQLGSIACAVHVKGKAALDVAVEVAQAASVRIPRTVGELVPALHERLSRSHGRRHFNLVVDALDEAVSPAQARLIVKSLLLPIARQCSSLGARVVVGSRRVDDGGELLRVFGRAVVLIDLDRREYFTLADLTNYAQATLALLGDERLDNPYADPAVAEPVARRIAALAEPNFLIAGLIARSHGMYDTEAADPALLSFTATVDKALAEYLQRLPPVGGVPATTVLTALAYAQAPGLSLELWQVALDALEVPVPHDELAAFAGSSAANFLVESSNDAGTPRYRLFHQALNDALRRGRSDERALAVELIRHGREGAGGWARADPYLLRTLPAFAARAGMIDALLLDDGFLLHADLPRLTPLTGQANTEEGTARARLLRLTPQAIQAGPAERAAMFGVTAEIESLRSTFAARQGLPYRIRWASVTRRAEHSALVGYPGTVRGICPIIVDRHPHLATVGDFPFVRLWNPASGQHRDLPLPAGRMAAVCVVTAGGRELLAVAGRSGRVFFVDPADGTPAGSLAGPETPIHALAALAVDHVGHLAAGCDDGMIRMWRLTDVRSRAIPAHDGPIRAMAVVRAGPRQLLATGGDDRAARIWNPATGELVRKFTDHIDSVRALCPFTVDGRRLMATSNFRGVQLWSRGSGPVQYGQLGGHESAVRAVTSIEVDGRVWLATAATDGQVLVWDSAGRQGQLVLTGHTAAVHAACGVTIDGREYLATVSQDRSARLWDLAAAEVQRRGRGRISAACTVRIGPRLLAAVVADNGRSIRLLDVETGAEVGEVGHTTGSVAGLCTVAGRDRDLIVSATDDGLLQTWDPTVARQLFARAHKLEPLRAICPFRDSGGRVLLAAAGNGRTTLRVFRPDTGRTVTRRRMGGLLPNDDAYEHLRAVRLMHQVAAGLLATAGDHPSVLVWRTNGSQLTALDGHLGGVRALTTVPGKKRPLLVTGSDDQTIRLWDAVTGHCVATLAGHADGVTALCQVTVDNRPMLVSGSRDRTVRVWDLAARTAVLAIPVHYPVVACLEVSGLLFVGLTAGSLALDLDAGRNALAHFQRT